MRSNEAAASAEPKPKPRSRRASGRTGSATTARAAGVAETTAAAAQLVAEQGQNAAATAAAPESPALAQSGAAPAIQVPSYPAQWTLTQRLEAEFVRASNIGARLAAAGQKIMAGLPPGAGPEETVLYMLQCQNTALEQSAAVLQVA